MTSSQKTTRDLIDKINKSRTYTEVFCDITNWITEYKNYAKLIHPDVCKESGAKEAITKLNSYREELHKGKSHIDDAGKVIYSINKCTIIAEKIILNNSKRWFDKLISYKEKMDIDFQRYIPKTMTLGEEADISHYLGVTLTKRAVPLSSLGVLPQEHVNWILSRMLEFVAYMHKKGLVHAGINPNSVYVEPQNHGINVISFYHTTEINKKLTTASGLFINFYPDHVKTTKIATPDVDIELCKRTAIYMLGDKSGIGTSLRKTHNTAFLDFINKPHTDSVEAYLEYRKMIDNNFERKFVPLTV